MLRKYPKKNLLSGQQSISKERLIVTQLFKHINSIPDDGKEHLVSDLCGEQFCFNMFRTKAGRDELLITKIKVNNGIIMLILRNSGTIMRI